MNNLVAQIIIQNKFLEGVYNFYLSPVFKQFSIPRFLIFRLDEYHGSDGKDGRYFHKK